MEPCNFCVSERITPPRKVVAIVGDDFAVRKSMMMFLEAHGIRAVVYPSCSCFLNDAPDIACLIVDCQMVDLNGIELVAEVRRRGQSMPAIIIAAKYDVHLEKKAAAVGISKILETPLMADELLSAIEKEVGNSS